MVLNYRNGIKSEPKSEPNNLVVNQYNERQRPLSQPIAAMKSPSQRHMNIYSYPNCRRNNNNNPPIPATRFENCNTYLQDRDRMSHLTFGSNSLQLTSETSRMQTQTPRERENQRGRESTLNANTSVNLNVNATRTRLDPYSPPTNPHVPRFNGPGLGCEWSSNNSHRLVRDISQSPRENRANREGQHSGITSARHSYNPTDNFDSAFASESNRTQVSQSSQETLPTIVIKVNGEDFVTFVRPSFGHKYS